MAIVTTDNYRILWTTPNLPYNDRIRVGIKSSNGYIGNSNIASNLNYASYLRVYGNHATEYSLPFNTAIVLAASLQQYTIGSFSTNHLINESITGNIYDSDYNYQRWSKWDTIEAAQIKFYEGAFDFENTFPNNEDLITGIVNDASTNDPENPPLNSDVIVTAVAYIMSDGVLQYITHDTITVHLVPDNTDFGIYIDDSSTTPYDIILPYNGLYNKSIEIRCETPGNTLSNGSFFYIGDDFIQDNCTIEDIETTAKSVYIDVNLDTTNGELYKEYNGKYIITGSGNPNHSNELNIKFLPSENELITVNTASAFLLTYLEDAVVTAQLLTVPGLILKAAVSPNIIQFVDPNYNDSNLAEYTLDADTGYYVKFSDVGEDSLSVNVLHNERRLTPSVTGDIVFTAFEAERDSSGNIISETIVDYSYIVNKTVEVTFDKIIMPDPITIVINQVRKKIYFEFQEYNSSINAYDDPVRAYEGETYEPAMIYPAEGSDINVFTKKYKLSCHGSDWRIAGIVDDNGEFINWVQTSLDEGRDYEPTHAVYSFSIWTNPNPYIIPRDGYIKLISTKTTDNGDPRATVRIKVHQEKAVYDPDFTLTLVPLVDTAADSSVLVDSSICSPFTLSPVYGKKYQIRVTNNCDYDILHIDSVEVEGPKQSPNYYINMFPDIDISIDTNDTGIDSSNISIDISDIYGKLNPDTSVGSINPYYSRKAITILLPAMGYIESSEPMLDKYVSFKVTCYNESQMVLNQSTNELEPTNFVSKNTDPRHLHQIGRLRSAAFEGYDYNPEQYPITTLDKLYAFSNEDDTPVDFFVDEEQGQHPTHKVFSIRTGIEILPILDTDTDKTTRGIEDSDNPLWNKDQILDERCIVIAWNDLDDFLQDPVHRERILEEPGL